MDQIDGAFAEIVAATNDIKLMLEAPRERLEVRQEDSELYGGSHFDTMYHRGTMRQCITIHSITTLGALIYWSVGGRLIFFERSGKIVHADPLPSSSSQA
jgi:hypothetical protein